MASSGKKTIQWHPAFYAGMQLEFRDFDVEHIREHQLTKAPIRMDLLIIKKRSDEIITNELGTIFRKYNIIEYKSPKDVLTIETFYKVQGYACFYITTGEKSGQYRAGDITISYYRHTHPRELIRGLQADGFTVTRHSPGINDVTGPIMFRSQIIVTKELLPATHAFLKVLTNQAVAEDIRTFVMETQRFSQPGDRSCVDAIFEVSNVANEEMFRKIKEEENMSEAFREFMKEELKAEYDNGWDNGQNSLSKLFSQLFKLGRISDAERAANDEAYRHQLLKEFQLA